MHQLLGWARVDVLIIAKNEGHNLIQVCCNKILFLNLLELICFFASVLHPTFLYILWTIVIIPDQIYLLS